jgi:hypothetical protein
MATFRAIKAGVTVRNVTEPEFETPSGERTRLERQVRAGVSLVPYEGWILAADLDLLRSRGPIGLDSRDLAIGTEGRVATRLTVRGGTRFDTAADGPGGRSATGSLGASYAVMASFLLDAQVTAGSEFANQGWGISARFTY